MKIERVWAMPNKQTFQIKAIKKLILDYQKQDEIWLDLFPYPFYKDAQEVLEEYISSGKLFDGVLFDPPYSPRQLKECYDNRGEALHDTKSSVWSTWKNGTSNIIKPGGICISFGWSTNGLGKNRGFEIERILLVAHGGNHNDTICTVERKIQED